ncbi:MAG: hypothetical protein M1826_003352 [Phylliscum demangeonii]|nr:MAG: hypothetical protein M1826_003352 [Phylliscum demangeonii]
MRENAERGAGVNAPDDWGNTLSNSTPWSGSSKGTSPFTQDTPDGTSNEPSSLQRWLAGKIMTASKISSRSLGGLLSLFRQSGEKVRRELTEEEEQVREKLRNRSIESVSSSSLQRWFQGEEFPAPESVDPPPSSTKGMADEPKATSNPPQAQDSGLLTETQPIDDAVPSEERQSSRSPPSADDIEEQLGLVLRKLNPGLAPDGVKAAALVLGKTLRQMASTNAAGAATDGAPSAEEQPRPMRPQTMAYRPPTARPSGAGMADSSVGIPVKAGEERSRDMANETTTDLTPASSQAGARAAESSLGSLVTTEAVPPRSLVTTGEEPRTDVIRDMIAYRPPPRSQAGARNADSSGEDPVTTDGEQQRRSAGTARIVRSGTAPRLAGNVYGSLVMTEAERRSSTTEEKWRITATTAAEVTMIRANEETRIFRPPANAGTAGSSVGSPVTTEALPPRTPVTAKEATKIRANEETRIFRPPANARTAGSSVGSPVTTEALPPRTPVTAKEATKIRANEETRIFRPPANAGTAGSSVGSSVTTEALPPRTPVTAKEEQQSTVASPLTTDEQQRRSDVAATMFYRAPARSSLTTTLTAEEEQLRRTLLMRSPPISLTTEALPPRTPVTAKEATKIRANEETRIFRPPANAGTAGSSVGSPVTTEALPPGSPVTAKEATKIRANEETRIFRPPANAGTAGSSVGSSVTTEALPPGTPVTAKGEQQSTVASPLTTDEQQRRSDVAATMFYRPPARSSLTTTLTAEEEQLRQTLQMRSPPISPMQSSMYVPPESEQAGGASSDRQAEVTSSRSKGETGGFPKPSRFSDGSEEVEAAKGRRPGRKVAATRRREKFVDDDDLAHDEDDEGGSVSRAEVRRQRKLERAARKAAAAPPTAIEIPDFISVATLARGLKVKMDDFTRKLEELGFGGLGHDHVLNGETAGLIAMEYHHEPVPATSSSEDLAAQPAVGDKSTLPSRPPIVTIMGHVDHGKTTLLDFLRKSSVVASEFGGITQHIGAFSVLMPSGKTITFLDTPGHEAFLSMRQRGAHLTDIVILVVAADDSVKPQTMEAIKHAQAAGVPMIVAINKIDKPGADPDRVQRDLALQGVPVEAQGGEVQAVAVSGKTGQGMAELEEAVIALAEMLDVRADRTGPAEGWIVEATTKKAGRVATVLVRRGTFRHGQVVVAGHTWARIRQLKNEAGVRIGTAGPGTPVELDGWKEQPQAGDEVLQAPDEAKAKAVVAYRLARAQTEKMAVDVEAVNEVRQQHDRERREQERIAAAAPVIRRATGSHQHNASAGARSHHHRRGRPMPLNHDATPDAGTSTNTDPAGPVIIPFIIKADVSGSAEAVSESLASIGNELVQTRVLRAAVGPITEFDIEHAAAAKGHVLAFNVTTAEAGLGALADSVGVQLLQHNVIYHLTDEVKQLLSAQLPPIITHSVTGEAEIAEIFEINVRAREMMPVAGCKVRNGVLTRSSKARVMRGSEIIFEGPIASLRHGKKDVSQMRKGTECGIAFTGWSAFAIGDQVQCVEERAEKRFL